MVLTGPARRRARVPLTRHKFSLPSITLYMSVATQRERPNRKSGVLYQDPLTPPLDELIQHHGNVCEYKAADVEAKNSAAWRAESSRPTCVEDECLRPGSSTWRAIWSVVRVSDKS
jgi:hypothetical protein